LIRIMLFTYNGLTTGLFLYQNVGQKASKK
jgi:hypothetical protein